MVLDRYLDTQYLAAALSLFDDSASIVAWWCLSAALTAAWWILWSREHNALAAWVLLAAVAFLGSAWHHWQWHLYGQQEVARFAAYQPTPACVDVIACGSPERVAAPSPTPLRAIPGTEQSRLVVEALRIRDGQRWQSASGRCRLIVEGHLLGIHPGDRLRVFGQLARPAPPLNPGEFDFAAHARGDRELTRIRSTAPECVTRLDTPTGWRPTLWLDDTRVRAKEMVRGWVGPRRAGLAAAILLGAREGLPYEETEPYLVTGTIHVLVVSGMNVAILATGLVALMQIGWLSRRAGLLLIMVVIATYTLLAESQPPVMRAAVLGGLMCVAAWIGRRGVAFNSLFAAALLVLALNPSDLFRGGPQLSFLAVAVLIWIGNWPSFRTTGGDALQKLIDASRPWYDRMFRWVGRWTGWLLVTSLAVWLATLPLVLNRFHVASPVAVLISPVIWLVVVVAMWSGFLMLVAGWLFNPIGMACGAVCNWSLSGLESVVAWAEAMPGGHFWAPGPAWWWVLVFYLGLLLVMIWGRSLVAPRWQVAALALWIIIGLVPAACRTLTRDGLDCSFLAVGHGVCVLVEGPNGETLIYDAGAIGSPERATQTIASYLWHRGIMRIDGLIISHADIDHYNAVPGLLERFQIADVYVSPVMFRSIGDPAARRGVDVLREALDRSGVSIHEIWAGDRLHIGDEVALDVLHPPRRGVIGSDNANSVTLAIEYAGQRILLPGDLESPGLEDLIAELPQDSDVVLAPHHGSRRSDPPGFARWSTPEWVVVSGGGADADIGPVKHTYENAGARVLITNDVGTVRVQLRSGHEAAVTTWLEADPARRIE
jgi:competence protein ComEC